MNKICKSYISDVRKFLPILGKEERDYIAKLKGNIQNFCDEEAITTKEELYEQYGVPNDIVNNYYSSIVIEN